ncbi:MAG: M20/M25/M40 family metallo-hydrolase [Holophagae bacterium]|nr:M20/M25/M40 family metallo-hydrolase [Holophagae bacterium]
MTNRVNIPVGRDKACLVSTETKILDIAQDLIRFQSTVDRLDQLQAVVNYVADLFSNADYFVKVLTFNGVPSILVTTEATRRPDILFNGHLDVVAGYPSQFIPEIKEGLLVGRGSVDMKLFDAVAIQAMLDLHIAQPELSLGCYFSCDEEVGGSDGAKQFVKAGYSSRLLINGDAGVDYALVTGSKGILRFTLTAETQPGRPAYPWEGTNAAQLLLDGFNRIQARFPGNHAANATDNWQTTFSISKLETEQHPSGLPYKAQMTLGINFIDDLSYNELFQELKALVPELKLEMTNVAERLEVDDQLEIYQRFISIAERNFGRTFQIKKDNGSSDAKFFKDAMDEIIIVKMPGAGAHEPDEYARIDGIMPMYNTLVELCQAEYQRNQQKIQIVGEMV